MGSLVQRVELLTGLWYYQRKYDILFDKYKKEGLL